MELIFILEEGSIFYVILLSMPAVFRLVQSSHKALPRGLTYSSAPALTYVASNISSWPRTNERVLVLFYFSDPPHFRHHLPTSFISEIIQDASCFTVLDFSTSSLDFFPPAFHVNLTPASSLRPTSDIISFKKCSLVSPLLNTGRAS